METTNHTPGPWYTSDTGNHQGLVISEANGANICVTYDKRDATLIAAAPEMLEALKLIERWTSDEVIASRGTKIERYCLELVRTAIAKAEGRE